MSHLLKRSVRKYVQCLAAGTATVALIPGSLLAQEQSTDQLEEVVVTGTLIRGVEAVGSQTIGLDEEAVAESGAVTTNELLATVPQVSNFFNQQPEQDPRGAGRLQVNRPNIRNLPGINSATGGTTLLLLDGHRMTPVGIDQSSPDSDIIPGRVIQRLEIITDGGSSLYGADAVGGVVNFNTLDSFEGAEVDVGYDVGDDYDAWQLSFIGGTSWDNGSGYIFLGTTDRDQMNNEDRDWAAAGDWSEDGAVLTPDGSECITPVGAITTWYNYGPAWTDNPAAPGAGVTPVGDPCDIRGKAALVPEQTRDNVFLGLTQDFSDALTLKVKSYYMKRETTYRKYPIGSTIAEPGPNELGVPGMNGDLYESAQVGFSYGAHPSYKRRDLEVEIETWGITPELIIDLKGSWQSRNTFHYGHSDNTSYDPLIDREKQGAYIMDGALDPLNVAAADAAVINDILNFETAAEAEQDLWFIRSIADGELFSLPAGILRAAVGVEYAEEEAEKSKADAARGASIPSNSASRDVTSVFGELSVPVLESLDLSLSVRYDDYSDFGDTTNPNIGINWFPAEWILLYGKWGESFNAPTVIDSLTPGFGRYIFDVASSVPDPNMERTNPSRDDVLLVEGSSGTLLPQTAKIWAAGFEIRPLEGLLLKLHYYDIEFDELLGAPNPQQSTAVLLNPDKFVFEPTQDEYDSFVADINNPEVIPLTTGAEDVGVIVDRRIDNTDQATLKGIDFGVHYGHETRFGSMSYGVTGNYQTEFDLTQGANVTDQLAFNPDLLVSGNIGWSRDNVRARVTLKYTDEYDADPGIAVNQGSVDDFLSTDLFIAYDFDSRSKILEGVSVRLNVDNVFDEDPPEYRVQKNPSFSQWGFTMGRIFKMGITKAF
jgi:iron complex outermembrane recepter protein